MSHFDPAILATVKMDVVEAWEVLQHGYDARILEIKTTQRVLPSNLEVALETRRLLIRHEKALNVVYAALHELARLKRASTAPSSETNPELGSDVCD